MPKAEIFFSQIFVFVYIADFAVDLKYICTMYKYIYL